MIKKPDTVQVMNTPLIYLASPYSVPDDLIEKFNLSKNDLDEIYSYRLKSAARMGAFLAASGNNVFNPITHSHSMHDIISSHYNEDMTHAQWMTLDMFFLRRSDILCINTDYGWELSKGISQESTMMQDNKKPVIHMNPKLICNDMVPEIILEVFSDVSA